VVGVEGGSSVLDPTGQPTATPQAEIRAMSPRHLEAAAARTFQVLVEGDYSGVLEAGVHYQPVRRDLSDIEAALELSLDLPRAQAMVDRAHAEIVASGRYSWRTAVSEITDLVLT
jgi:hypothetical protein